MGVLRSFWWYPKSKKESPETFLIGSCLVLGSGKISLSAGSRSSPFPPPYGGEDLETRDTQAKLPREWHSTVTFLFRACSIPWDLGK